jgi:cation:H+ antiporter
MIGYTVFLIYQSRREGKAYQNKEVQNASSKKTITLGKFAANIGLILMGLFMLVLGCNWLVKGAVTIAQYFGISQLVIGLTIVAVGTSLPEVATSVVAAIHGERDIAVGNVVGSNIFNILGVLGLSAILTPGGIGVSVIALRLDIPIMIAVAVVCLPIFFTGNVISRWEGGLFLAYYLVYTLYQILSTTPNAMLPTFTRAMLWVVIPLTALTLMFFLLRTIRIKR